MTKKGVYSCKALVAGLTVVVITNFAACDALLPRRSTWHTNNNNVHLWHREVKQHSPSSIQSRANKYFCGIESSRNNDSRSFMQQPYHWEGDDLRWTRKMRRRLAEAIRALQPAKASLIFSNMVIFLYQIINAVQYIRHQYPNYWPQQALFIIADTLSGASITGPFTMDFVHSVALSRTQPHRYITSGFLHGNLLHLLINMDSLRRLPSWLETGLGWPLYLTAYLTSIITGNMAYTWLTKQTFDGTICLGASGGICGLYGLMFIALAKMRNTRATIRVAQSMGFLFLYGLFFENISNAAHVGGFFGGVLVGLIFGPNYRKSYTLRRKWSVEVDTAPRGYRDVMGFGNVPTSSGTLPIQVLWIVAAIAAVTQPRWRSIPSLILTGLLRPGALTRSI
jgi:membrane associated rhomboid family serine protease